MKDVGSYKNYDPRYFQAELFPLPFHEIYCIDDDVNEKLITLKNYL